MQRSVEEQLLSPRCRHKAEYEVVAQKLEPQLARAIGDELRWREEHGLPTPSPDDPYALERYVERQSVLKKHFQEVLFLKLAAQRVEHRLRNWFGVAAAIAAALWAFPLGLFLTTDRMSGFGIGFGATVVLFALMYAVKDRIKELVRGWLTERVTKDYAGRITTMSTPPRLLEKPARLARLRESFHVRHEFRPDPVHPDVGATRPVVVFRYQARGAIEGDPRLVWQGLTRAKLVFRYDLTPLFSRLDDAVKRVPVLAADGKGVRFAEAPRSYRLPIELTLQQGGKVRSEGGLLVAHKLGLEPTARPTPLAAAQPAAEPLSIPVAAVRR